MPLFVWFAIAIAILLIGGGTAVAIPKAVEVVGGPATEVIGQVGVSFLGPLGIALAVVIVIVAVVIGLKQTGRI